MRDVAGLYVVRKGVVPRTLLVFKEGDWFFPGGKRERGESLLETLSREVHEELRVSLKRVPAKLHEGVFAAPGGHTFRFHTFWCSAGGVCGECVLNPHDTVKEFCWVDEPLGLNLTAHARFILERFFPA